MRSIIVSIMLAAAVAGAHADFVIGNGRVDTERRSVSAFTSVSVGGSGTLRVHRGGQRVEITADSNILPYITTSISGGELKIGFKPFTTLFRSTKLEFDVTLPELRGLVVSGSGSATVDLFKGDSFKAVISGSGGLKADLDYKSLDILSSGSGRIDATVVTEGFVLRCSGSGGASIKGAADKAELRSSGSGKLGARGFAVHDARIAVSGSGGAEIRVAKSLDAAVSGSGSVRYWGSPAVSQRVSGSGRISKAGD